MPGIQRVNSLSTHLQRKGEASKANRLGLFGNRLASTTDDKSQLTPSSEQGPPPNPSHETCGLRFSRCWSELSTCKRLKQVETRKSTPLLPLLRLSAFEVLKGPIGLLKSCWRMQVSFQAWSRLWVQTILVSVSYVD